MNFSTKVPVIFDADSLWARSYYRATSNEPEQDPSLQVEAGVQIALQSVISMLNPITDKLTDTPTHLLFCFDGAIAKRDKGRAPKTPEYIEGKKALGQLLPQLFGAATAFPDGEADDAVATAAKREAARPETKTVYVVSGDKDLQQLASDKISYYSLNDKSVLSWTFICNKWAIKHPQQLALALAILGDASDKIQGIKGWGKKKVEKLFVNATAETELNVLAEQFAAQMNEEQLRNFQESLNLTLLLTDIPNVPDPTPIVIGGFDLLEELQWERIKQQLLALQTNYDYNLKKEVLDEAI